MMNMIIAAIQGYVTELFLGLEFVFSCSHVGQPTVNGFIS